MKQYRLLIVLMLLLITKEVNAQLTLTYPSVPSYSVGATISPLTPTANFAPSVNGQTSTLAGSGSLSSIDGVGTTASFDQPLGTAVDASGNIYIADAGSHCIRKITPGGTVATLAGTVGLYGSANGQGRAASFYHPVGLAVDAAGNIYVADENNNMIRKITPGGVVSTLAGSTTAGSSNGTGAGAGFNEPCGVAVDAAGNVYVADYNNNEIRKITPSGVVTTLAGSGSVGSANGTGTGASFNHPFSVTIDGSGNLFVADRLNNMIRKIVISTATVSTLAGQTTAGYLDGSGTGAKFNGPTEVTVDGLDNVYVTDEANNRIRIITSSGMVSAISGIGTTGSANGAGNDASFYYPFGIAVDAFGNLYVGDYMNNLVRKVITTPYSISPQLPPGLNFATATGIISGTPTTTSPATTYTINAYSTGGIYEAGIGSCQLSIAVVASGVLNPSNNQNNIITYQPRIAGLTTNAALLTASNNPTQVETSVAYFDGLGRPVQTVAAKASPTQHDLVQPMAYDAYDREPTKYLPYTVTGTGANDGSYKTNAISSQASYYATPPTGVTSTPFPWSGTTLEASPLSRPTEQGAPGDNWQIANYPGNPTATNPGHTIKTIYTANNNISWTTDSVHSMQVAMYSATINANANFSRTLVPNKYYSANQLSVTITKDENWTSGRAGTTETYTDKDGHVVLKRTYNYTTSLQQLSTYYVYDDLGNLAFVIPPSAGGDAAATISAATLNNLCYQYRYDTRSRLSQKKLPGKGWEFTVYNSIDQPVATQDSLQRVANNWVFTKYDGQGREVLNGLWNNGTNVSQSSLQTTLSAITNNLWETATGGTGNGYTNVAWPTTYVTTTLGLNYYDSYTNIPSLPSTYNVTTGVSKMTAGLSVGNKTAILNTPTDMLWGVIYYDDLGRPITTYAQHYLGGIANTSNYDLSKVTYNFTNVPTTATRQHWNTASTTVPMVTITNSYIYDHMGRKLKTWEQITNGNSTPSTKTLLSQSVYNELGQLITKQLYNTLDSTNTADFYQSIAYTYNERGWLLTSSAPLFAMQLYYNTGTAKAYNGNIMYQYWGTPGSLTNNYAYAYDKMNRLLSGNSTANNNENGIAYDLEGNMTALKRYQAGTLIDQLGSYTYSGNQLLSVNDATTNNAGLVSGTMTDVYDGNGNLQSETNTTTTTQNKSFTYNLLNLPKTVTTATGTVTYTYDAIGNKLRKVDVISGNTTTEDYISGIQYKTGATAIDFIQTEEGKAVPTTSGYDYYYYLGDNLGNTRVTFDTQSGSAAPLQADNYYPFGMEINVNVTNPKNEYLYNKKELQEETQEYDYGARFYDPVIARWTSIDPLAEKSRRWSSYNYVEDDPIRMIDPDGMASVNKADADGEELLKEKQEEHKNGRDKPVVTETKNVNETFSYDKGSKTRGTDHLTSTDIKTTNTVLKDGFTVNVKTVTTVNTTTVDKDGKIGPASQVVTTTSADKMVGGGIPLPGTFSTSTTQQAINLSADKDLAKVANTVSDFKKNDPDNASPLQVAADRNNSIAVWTGRGIAVGAVSDAFLGTSLASGGGVAVIGLGAAFYESNPEHLSANTNIK